MAGRRRVNRSIHDVEPDLTAMISLMVVLIPFLLLSSAFTQLNVLKVDRTGNRASAPSQAAPPPLMLDVFVYQDRFVVDNRGVGTVATIPVTATGPDYVALNNTLHSLKTQYPTVNNALLRVAENVDYQQVIKTMDATRLVTSNATGGVYSLFSEIQVASLEGTS